jgi:hypothetical protein
VLRRIIGATRYESTGKRIKLYRKRLTVIVDKEIFFCFQHVYYSYLLSFSWKTVSCNI